MKKTQEEELFFEGYLTEQFKALDLIKNQRNQGGTAKTIKEYANSH